MMFTLVYLKEETLKWGCKDMKTNRNGSGDKIQNLLNKTEVLPQRSNVQDWPIVSKVSLLHNKKLLLVVGQPRGEF